MFKKITVFLLATIIFVVGISPVSASEEISTADDFGYVIGGSAITQSMLAKAVATITGLGFNPWMVVVTGIVLITLTSSESKKPTVFNSAGCVWSGPAHSGTWMGPMRV
ncbi:MAG: hypothetical protein GX053_14870 [Tissierella sp.]|nr:hypothetical protein [Tissierella sp.]